MKAKKSMLLLGIAALLLSCGGGNGGDLNSPPSNIPPRKFWAQNAVTDAFYQVEAELLAEGHYCTVWVEKGSGVSSGTANNVARTYDTDVYPKMINTFGIKGTVQYQGETIAHNTMELADWLGDGDGKLCILLLDIKDDYKPGVNESYIAGYFWAVNFVINDPAHPYYRYSNECDMIYLDVNPARVGSKESNITLAHEMQHMMNFVDSIILREAAMDLWIDEGLSAAAEWLYYGSHPAVRWQSFNDDPSGLIRKGNNFFVWGNRGNESIYASLDDYSTVYLFFQWLRLQAGNTNIYNKIATSSEYSLGAVTSAADTAMGGKGYDNWSTLLKTWLAANYINASSGPYGYMNDGTLKNIKARTVPAGTTSLSLAPGEGVYSVTSGFSLPGASTYIKYAGLNKDNPALSDTQTYDGGALLTYNVNTNPAGQPANGTTTGVAASVSANMSIAADSLPAALSGPYAVSMSDVLRRKGHEASQVFDISKLKREIAIIE
jgi:hypothetical protein